MDPFASLGLEPRLTLTAEELREAFREAGKRAHPDSGGSSEDFTLIQDAYTRLGSPARRLRAWLERNGIPGDERGTISPELLDLFGKVGEVLQEADAVIKRRDAALSTLAKAILEPQVQALRDRLAEMQAKVSDEIHAQEGKFDQIEAGTADGWLTARDLAFLEKWQAGLRARFASLW